MNGKAIGYRNLNYHCRLHCLSFIRSKGTQKGEELTLFFKFKAKSNKFVFQDIAKPDDDWEGFFANEGRKKGKKIKMIDLFKKLYGYFIEDKTRKLFIMSRAVIRFYYQPEEFERQVWFNLVDYLPHMMKSVHIILDRLGYLTPCFDGLEKRPLDSLRVDSFADGIGTSYNFLKMKRVVETLDLLHVHPMNYCQLSSKFLAGFITRSKIVRLRIAEIYDDLSDEEDENEQKYDPKNSICRTLYMEGTSAKRKPHDSNDEEHQVSYHDISQPIFPFFRNLRRLTITNFRFENINVYITMLRNLRKEAKQIRFLSLRNNKIFHQDQFSSLCNHPLTIILEKNEVLEELVIDLNKYSVRDQLEFTNSTLQKLYLDYSNLNKKPVHIQAPSNLMENITRWDERRRQQEQNVDIEDSIVLDDTFLSSLVCDKKCQGLNSFSIFSKYDPKAENKITEVISKLPSQITKIGLYFPMSGITDSLMNVILSKKDQLLEFRCSFENITGQLSRIFQLSNLQLLTLGTYPKYFFDSHTQNNLVRPIVKNHQIHSNDLRIFERNMNNLRRFEFDRVHRSFLYFIRYSEKLGNIEFSTNGEVEYDIHRSSLIRKEDDHHDGKKQQQQQLQQQQKQNFKKRRELFVTRRMKKISREVSKVNLEEEKEYLQESIKKWGLMEPHVLDPKKVRWKHYYEKRMGFEKKKRKKKDVEVVGKLKNTFRRNVSNFGFLKTEEEKKLFEESLYVVDVRLGYRDCVLVKVVFFSIYGDGDSFEVVYARRHKEGSLSNEFFETIYIRGSSHLSRSLANGCNFMEYEIIGKEDVDYYRYCISTPLIQSEEEEDNIMSRKEFVKMLYVMVGGGSDLVYKDGGTLDLEWMLYESGRKFGIIDFSIENVRKEGKKVYHDNMEKEDSSDDVDADDELIDDFAERVIDDDLGVDEECHERCFKESGY